MSDITLLLNNYGQDMDQDDDDYSRYYESSMLDQQNPDDHLTPLQKLQKYSTSINVFTRQMVARSLIETVQSIQSVQECLSLLDVITHLSNDLEPSVRNELMEHLPPCSLMIMNMRLVPNAISDYILPVMVKYLTDSNNQVRKLTQNALLQLIDQEMISRVEVERQICPVLLQLTEPDSGDDFRTEAVGLMTSITPLIGNENAQYSFLRRFGDLCADPLFHVRKVCASNFGDMCSVLTQDTTEQQLLPLFARLCEDGVWGVRKACAETFIAVSGSCSRQVRYDRLSPLFVGLLCDKSRWVQMAAYLALGQFISTFAEPERSGFDIDENGMLVRCQKMNLNTTNTVTSDRDSPLPPLEDPSLESDRLATSSPDRGTQTNINNDNTTTENKPEDNFNNFEFWRTPIPNLPDLLDEQDGTTTSTDTESSPTPTTPTKGAVENTDENTTLDTSLDDDNNLENQRSDAVSPRPSVQVGDDHHHDDFMHLDPATHGFHSDSEDEDNSSNFSLQQSTSNYASSIVDDESLHNQTAVPPALLEHYISMTEENKAKTIDGELPRHCAYTMPGVVLALGAEHWSLLKDTYELLSTDMQWKVRRSLAFSIHDLALILGEEICVRDLVPVFNSFLKDLDEVRVGVLNHLYDFISLLPDEWQKEYLQLFNEFRVTDNMRNWRFRGDLAQQLMNLSTLYTETELADYICPVALELAADKVAEVRQNAFHLICILIRRVSDQERDKELLHKFVASIVSLGSPSQHWVQRKACSQIYQHILEGGWYDSARFAECFLINLLTLCKDTVPNIRFIAAQALISFMKSEHYQSLPEDDETRKAVDNTLESLQQDDDRDVRYYSGGQVKERTFSVSDDDEDDEDEGVDGRSEEAESGGGMDSPYMQELTRGLRDYTINYTGERQTGHDDDEDDDDADLVEEVYMEEHGLVVCEDEDGDDDGFEDDESSQQHVTSPTSSSANAAVVEDYYADEDPASSLSATSNDVITITGEEGKTTTTATQQLASSIDGEVSDPSTTKQESSPSDEAPIVPTNPDIKPESDATNSESVSSSQVVTDNNENAKNINTS